jgi:hypothetical protein
MWKCSRGDCMCDRAVVGASGSGRYLSSLHVHTEKFTPMGHALTTMAAHA